jgi:hypothetical protein
MLQQLLKHEHLKISEQTLNVDVIKCAQALVNHKLGQSLYVIGQDFLQSE